jgi:hypothetical protein
MLALVTIYCENSPGRILMEIYHAQMYVMSIAFALSLRSSANANSIRRNRHFHSLC